MLSDSKALLYLCSLNLHAMLAFTKQGAGPTLILIHGFCESKEMWTAFARELSKSYTVYAVDLPGFGDSAFEQSSISLEEAAVAVHDWMEQGKISQPAVIGHSLGGYVALAMAELDGASLKAIGLFHSTAFKDDEEKIGIRNRTLSFIKKHGVEKFVDSFVPPLFSEQHRIEQGEAIAQLIERGKKSSKKGVLAFIEAMRDRKDRMDVWKNFPGPKLMIAGSLDASVKIEASRQHQPFASHYHELPETGHMGMFEEPEKTLQLMEGFLRDVWAK